MSRIFLDQDDSGIEYAWFDDTTGDLQSIERVEDVRASLEYAKAKYNEGLVNQKCEFRHVGHYPPNLLRIFAAKIGIPEDRLIRELGKNKELTKRLLNDRDISGFRTLPGTY